VGRLLCRPRYSVYAFSPLSNHSSISATRTIALHRDGVPDTTRLVTEENGVTMSKVMFFNGISYSKAKGDIGYLYNANN